MMRWQRAARAKLNKMFEAIQWATELAQWVNNKYPKMQLQVFTERYGTAGTI